VQRGSWSHNAASYTAGTVKGLAEQTQHHTIKQKRHPMLVLSLSPAVLANRSAMSHHHNWCRIRWCRHAVNALDGIDCSFQALWWSTTCMWHVVDHALGTVPVSIRHSRCCAAEFPGAVLCPATGRWEMSSTSMSGVLQDSPWWCACFPGRCSLGY